MQEIAEAARKEAEKLTAERKRAVELQQGSVIFREWGGTYSEPRYSNCRRSITIVGSSENGFEMELRGVDGYGPNGEQGCDKKTGGGKITKWTVKATVKDKYSDEIAADFSPRRGLSSNSGEVTGKFDGSVIMWSDKTEWVKNTGFGQDRNNWEKEKSRERAVAIAREVQKLRAQRDG